MHLRGQRLRGRVVVNRGKEEDAASVPHRSFDETTTSRADSQCKVMETRWGPEHFQERQGCLGKIIWGYHIIYLYIHSSLEWTLYLRSPLVLRWGIAAGMLWSDCTSSGVCFHMWHQWTVKITGKCLQRKHFQSKSVCDLEAEQRLADTHANGKQRARCRFKSAVLVSISQGHS